MTRLIMEWISDMEREIQTYNDNLKKQLGMDLCELAAKACGIAGETFREKMGDHLTAVIPVTSGEGVIGTFSESAAAIFRVMGTNAFVTESTDVSGISEGILKGADILLMADDNEYIALNVKTGAIGNNNIATAMGYVAALEIMAGTLKSKDVLVIGCGIVGRIAIEALKEKKAMISIYDKDISRVKMLTGKGIRVLADTNEIKNYDYILDATNEGGWLHKEMLADNAVISTPGVPLSLDEEAFGLMQGRVVHDYLQIGTAVMLGLVL